MVPLLVIAAFLAGAIPFGVIIARRRGVEIRERGSGNIGATNVARVLGVGTGLIVLVLDAGKGAAATSLAMHACGWNWVASLAGFAAILGHCFATPRAAAVRASRSRWGVRGDRAGRRAPAIGGSRVFACPGSRARFAGRW
jgi:hypothetical protein